MYAIRKNARKDTIQCNIESCKEHVNYLNSEIKQHEREIKKSVREREKYEKKLAELKSLLKTKTL